MTDRQAAGQTGGAATATVAGGSRISMVWFVPIVAALIGAWLVYKAASEKGPTIQIHFETANSLEAGKTKIRYRNVELGVVTGIHLDDDLDHVTLTAEMVPGVKDYLSADTRFWVVRARVAAGEVTGLGTLLGGAFISMDPIPLKKGEKPQRAYVGLEKAPAVTSDEPGTAFVLRSPRLGSVDVGSPVYYRQINVGRVTHYELTDTGEILIKIYVFAPHDERVVTNTRFWNAGGIDVTIDADGLKIDTESLVTVLLGGIAFDTPISLEEDVRALAGQEFQLYDNRQATQTPIYRVKNYYLTYLEEGVRGLSPGSPVEFRGFKLGQVVDVRLEVSEDGIGTRIPVLIEIQPERIRASSDMEGTPDPEQAVPSMVARGLRLQLRTGSLVTGQKFLAMDFFPDAPPAQVRKEGGYFVIPSVPTPGQEIVADLTRIADRLAAVPFDEIGRDLGATADGLNRLVNSDDLRATLENLSATLAESSALLATVNSDVAPNLARAVAEIEQTVASLRTLVDADTGTQREVTRLLVELTDAARSIRALTDYLERHPEALLRGKGEAQ
jgi:paraquat-inducible protein B